jgi:arylsulfatase
MVVSSEASLYLHQRVRYAFNWVGTKVTTIELTDRSRWAATSSPPSCGDRRSQDPLMPGSVGTLTLYVDDQEVGSGEIVTQPGAFCLVVRHLRLATTPPQSPRTTPLLSTSPAG